ncbi:gamma-glutamyl-gamma-aminobutyrate hydrolase family protein [Jatrophihabitans sp. DSM 45814]
MPTRPIIGITGYLEPASWGAWTDVPAALIPHAYVAKVEAAGGIALMIPPRLDADPAWASAVLGRLDGLVLAGGVDVEPGRYGQSAHPAVQAARRDRDAAELSLASVSAEIDLPVLGICRGMQVMAVAAGGTLEQHLPDRVGHNRHSPAPATYGEHGVRIDPASQLASILGTSIDVPSYHHQGVATYPTYVASAWEKGDATVEALEDPKARFRLAVQWHPEVSADKRTYLLFEALVEASRQAAGRSAEGAGEP